jgi:hypothetical protein
LKHFQRQWELLHVDPGILSIIREGFRAKFVAHPPLSRGPARHHFPGAATQQEIREQVSGLLDKQVLEEVAWTHSPGYFSRFFVVPKRDPGKWRPILDLSSLNTYIDKRFKMETTESIRAQLRQGEWATSIDLSEAYHHIPIHRSFRKYLRFDTEGKVYQYRALPMGLTDSARVFTKVAQVVKQVLQSRGIQINQYLDDWLIHGDTQERVADHTR